jgi:hypothetical protein
LNSNQNIFIFTAGEPAARAHLADSIANPIDESRVLEFFDLKDRELVSQINSEHGHSNRSCLFWPRLACCVDSASSAVFV